MKAYTATLFLLLFLLAAACSGLFNFGSTNADGTPKTPAEAVLVLRSIGDAALITWGSDWLQVNMPSAITTFDANEDGRLQLAEIEAHVDLGNPASLTTVLVIAVQLYQEREARRKSGLPT